ncbi:phosphate propanoyltransferase [Clostridium sp. 'deep sea']|uniref:phosphate propanoyltransferase n=1 Tax=Clostridium sp. 'deep sea' TaxID=2779445 RepID=UPI001896963E|nr:phosphate propanoyltransferase [Clostridium sp. 'deep sea']QOR35781.1 phosphate propanoyltransferase [Clostridium sp. 'deep sea']
MKDIVIGVSNRHLHVSQADLEALFGPGYELTNKKDLKQPGQYACEECVEICGPKGCFPKVRILGPVRPVTQVEISLTDSFKLGVKAPVRNSGDLAGTPGVTLKGPYGSVELKNGVIVAARHIHMHTEDAIAYGLKDNDIVNIQTVDNQRSVVFNNVLVRVKDSFAMEMHVDIDEANAAMLKNGDVVKLAK